MIEFYVSVIGLNLTSVNVSCTCVRMHRASMQKGWELMSVLLQIFPPSNLFFEYIDAFVFHRLRGTVVVSKQLPGVVF